MLKSIRRGQEQAPSRRIIRAKPLVEPLMRDGAKRDRGGNEKERRRSRRYYRKNKKSMQAEQKLRRQIPDVRTTLLKYYRDRYRRLRKKIRAQQKAHRQDPNVKRRTRKHRRQPHIMERERIRVRTYYADHPKARAERARYMREYFTRPDVIKSREEYFARLDVRKRRRELNRTYRECRHRLMPMLDSEDPFDRQSAAYSLGSRKFKRAIDRLADLLWDKEEFVRSAAVWALGEINDVVCIGPLVVAAESAKDSARWQSLKEAAEALAKISTRRSLESAKRYSSIATGHL